MARDRLPTLPDVPRADVLVATSNVPLRDEVAMRLWADGFRVREVDDENGLFDVLLSTAPEDPHPDLVVADVRFSGPGVRTMLSELLLAGTPIVYVGLDHDSAEADEVCRLAADYLTH